MKQGIILFLMALMILTGCASKRKSAQTVESVGISMEKSEIQSVEVVSIVDTSRTERGRITVTEVEFFMPDMQAGADMVSAIRSIRQTVIEREMEIRGEGKEVLTETGIVEERTEIKVEKSETVDVIRAPETKRWRYVCILFLGIAVLLVCLKLMPK